MNNLMYLSGIPFFFLIKDYIYFTGQQFIRISDFQSFTNYAKVVITSIAVGSDVTQINPEALDIEKVQDKKFYFKAQKEVSVTYKTEDGQLKKITLQHLLSVKLLILTWLYLLLNRLLYV